MKHMVPWSIFVLLVFAPAAFQAADFQSGSAPVFERQTGGATISSDPELGKNLFGEITLSDVIEIVMERHPRLAAAWHEIRAREGAADQAALPPNPTLFGEIEEFGGSGEFRGTEVMSSRIGVSQEISAGGKRARRIEAARIDVDLAVMEKESQAMELCAEARQRFLRVHTLQERLELEKEGLFLVHAMEEAIGKRVAAGEASPLDETKATVESALAVKKTEEVRRELDAARHALASMWGSEAANFSQVRLNYKEAEDVLEEGQWLALLEENVAYRVAKRREDHGRALVDLARSEAFPDIEVGGGVQRFHETDDHAYFLEFSIPLPILNRNQGAIREASELLKKAKKERETGLLEIRRSVIEVSSQARSAVASLQTMENAVIPAAEKSFAAIDKAYQLGEGDYLEMLDAQHTLLQSRHDRLELIAMLHELRIELDSLTGRACPVAADALPRAREME